MLPLSILQILGRLQESQELQEFHPYRTGSFQIYYSASSLQHHLKDS